MGCFSLIKEDFLPIPDAPEYEINSQLICRNAKSKYILKIFTGTNGQKYFSLHPKHKKHTIKRSPRTLRAQAKSASVRSSFLPISSLGNKYEINNRGTVRNASTKLILKEKDGSIKLHVGERKFICKAVADLLWEVHGIIRQRRFRPCPCFAENSQGKFFFPHMNACACFLATKIHYAVKTISAHLQRRENDIFGWKITYLDKDINFNDFAFANLKILHRGKNK